MPPILRQGNYDPANESPKDITISPTLADCTPVQKDRFAGGSLGFIPNTTITSVSILVSHDGITWGVGRDEDSQVIQALTVTKHVTDPVFNTIPSACFNYPLLKFQSQVGATEEEATLFLEA